MQPILTALALAAACTLPAWASPELAQAKSCMGCHTMDSKRVGPAFKDIAQKYRGDTSAADQLARKIRKGGSNVWGPLAMPANAQVNEADARILAAWVLSLK